MKKLLKISAFVLIVGLLLGLAGCPDDKGKEPDPGESLQISFESFTPPSIFVENLTGERLVAFKGSLNPNYLISGIPANATNHGLKKDSTLFYQTDRFVMLLITEAEYNANKDNLGASKIFARIFAFYNHTGTNNNVFQISAKIGGEGQLIVSNTSPFDVEIRSGGPTGEILGFAAARMTQGNVIYIKVPNIIDIYPVYKFFSPIDYELYSVTPKYTTGELIGKPFMKRIGFGNNELTHQFSMTEVEEQGDFGLSSGSAYLRINNNSGTALTFLDGTQPVITSLGIPAINVGKSENFTLSFGLNPDGTYPDSRNFAQLIIDAGQRTLQIPAQLFDLDYMYEIEVTGNTVSTLQLGTVVKKNKVDLEKIFGLNP
jgi:hypothetical protein